MLAFLYSPLLWGLLFVALPVLIHLINMLRHRRVKWAAIEFLLLSQKKHRTWVLIKQLLLLLLRMAAIAAIVMLVAQPSWRGEWNWLNSSTTHHVVLLDDSYSMSSVRGDKDLFDSAKDLTRQIVATASDRQHPQSLTLARFSQLTASDLSLNDASKPGDEDVNAKDAAAKPGGVPDADTAKTEGKEAGANKSAGEKAENGENGVDDKGISDKEAKRIAGEKLRAAIQKRFDFAELAIDPEALNKVKERLSAIQVSETDACIRDVLHTVELALSGDHPNEDRVIYLVSDFRERDWEVGEAIRSALQNLSDNRTRIELIDCSLVEEKTNLAITKLKRLPGTLAAGVPCSVEVTVKNYGKTTESATVSLEQDGSLHAVEKIGDIAPGKEETKQIQVQFPTPGQHSVMAQIESDAVAADNRRFLVLDVPEEVPVLVIDHSVTKADSLDLRTALAPGGKVLTGIRPRIEPPSFLVQGTLDRFAVIYVTDTGHLDPVAVERLERYVATGGSVVFFTGPLTNTRNVNDNFYRAGKGVFPVKLRGQVELVPDPIEKLPDVEVTKHPIFRAFDGPDSYLSAINVNLYMGLDETQKAALAKTSQPDRDKNPDGDKDTKGAENAKNRGTSAVKVLARLRDGSPFVIESTFGQGRVLTILSTAKPLWNNWAANPSYVISAQEIQAYLCWRPSDETVHKVGQPLVADLDAEEFRGTVRFDKPVDKNRKTPKRNELMTTVEATRTDGGRWIAAFNDTEHAGVYLTLLTTIKDIEVPRRTAINVEPGEGDLQRFQQEQLDETLAGVPFRYNHVSQFDANEDDSSDFKLQDYLLILLVLMLLVEQVLAWSCSYHMPTKRKGGDA